MTTKTLEDLAKFYRDPQNWRPPSMASIARFMGYRSKASSKKAIERMKRQQPKNIQWEKPTSEKE